MSDAGDAADPDQPDAADPRAAPVSDVAWVALGSNMGNRGQALAGLRHLLASDGVTVEALSSEILTRPVGVTAQGDFHNQVARLRSPAPWTPRRWLEHTRRAEQAGGRRESYHWGPRRADVDILLLGPDGTIAYRDNQLTVPHPQIPNRAFIGRLLQEVGARTP